MNHSHLFFFLTLLIIFVFSVCFFFFFNDTATTEIYTLSLHDALPIYRRRRRSSRSSGRCHRVPTPPAPTRSEEHTSELQSPCNLVCRLLLEKKKKSRRLGLHSYQARLLQLDFSRSLLLASEVVQPMQR